MIESVAGYLTFFYSSCYHMVSVTASSFEILKGKGGYMPLTDIEKELAKSSRCFRGNQWGTKDVWGTKDEGLTPEGLVAQARGERFTLDENEMYVPESRDRTIRDTAWFAVSQWVGFSCNTYLIALEVYRERIFERAMY